ncbi:hypothetical protein GCM10020331_061220 [Ectobacillus funiculus]
MEEVVTKELLPKKSNGGILWGNFKEKVVLITGASRGDWGSYCSSLCKGKRLFVIVNYLQKQGGC